MRVPHTDEPLWFGREFTASELVHHIAAHQVERYNRIDPHRMPCWELGVVETGSLDLLLEDTPLHVSAGEMAVIAPGVRFGSGEGRNAGRFYWIGLNVTGETSEAGHPWLAGSVTELEHLLADRAGRAVGVQEGLLRRARELVGLCLDDRSAPLARAGRSLVLAAEVAASLRGTAEAHPSADRDALAPALELVRDRLHTKPSVAELAEACGLPRATFCRHFRRCIGQTPAQYVRQQQIEQAAALLRGTDRSITDVAYGLGFSSSQYFSAVFRKYTGQSPSDYRRAYESGAATDSNDAAEAARYPERSPETN
jgi:AraC-like DNA-binding protein